MNIGELWTLQCMMFCIIIFGMVLKKVGVLNADGRKIITDLVLYGFLPCNIVASFQVEFHADILKNFALILGVATLLQVISYLASRMLFSTMNPEKRSVFQYCMIVSNSGFLGLPLVEGVFGLEGMMYASVFIIPLRIMMWSAGIACFTISPDLKTVVKKVATHPCIIAVYIGLFLMIFQHPLDQMLTGLVVNTGTAGSVIQTLVQALNKAIRSIGGCTTAATMLLIGSMMAEVKPRQMLDLDAAKMTVIRLGVLPLTALVICKVCRMDPLLTGVSVLLTAMPAGSTTAILAEKYGRDYVFGTKCVVLSTLISMLTVPLWCMLI